LKGGGGLALLGDQEPRSGRVYTMYHGTHTRDAPAIISRGFRRSADGLLGAGVYVSRNIRKAECYPLGAHQNDRVVLKLSVRVGRVKRIDRDHHPQQKSWHQDGYDCAWVPPNCGVSAIKSGREEDCVWDPGRIAVRFSVFPLLSSVKLNFTPRSVDISKRQGCTNVKRADLATSTHSFFSPIEGNHVPFSLQTS
uniref:PARP catalytic domain-containing protein n=1 Tax=Denticeps clupeoides TaxID=299321 RepID=A0AAY4E031_9TELE